MTKQLFAPRYTVVCLSLVLLFVAFLFVGSSNAQAAPEISILHDGSSATTIDFGSVDYGFSAIETISILNLGDSPLYLNGDPLVNFTGPGSTNYSTRVYFESLAGSVYHTCGISGGALLCWGSSGYGRLGGLDGSLPQVVPNLDSGITVVAVGNRSTCAVQNGGLKCFGHDGNGQLAGTAGSTTNYMPGLGAGTDVTDVATSLYHTCVVQNGGLQCWGTNTYGQTAGGTIGSAITGLETGVTSVDVSPDHTCVVQNGGVKCFGRDDRGQSGGSGGSTTEFLPGLLAGSGAVDVSIGSTQSCALQNGGVKCWGGDTYYGTLSGDISSTTVFQPALESGVSALSVGHIHTCVIQEGNLKCFGDNRYGQLGFLNGTGPSTTSTAGMDVATLPIMADTATAVTAGQWHSCAVVSGALRCWGLDWWNQTNVPHGSTSHNVSDISSSATALAAGENHSCAVVHGGVRCWGYDGFGAAGGSGGSTADVIANLESGITSMAADSTTTCVIQNGGLKCFGRDFSGMAGGSGGTASYVSGIDSGVTSVDVGIHHTCAVQNGAAKCFGSNTDGQVGPGGSSTSVPVPGLEAGVTDVAAADDHSCAIHNGAVKCWGNNTYGQYGGGDGSLTTAVPGLETNVTDISAKRYNTCAVQNGCVKCWGSSGYGALADGSPTQCITGLETGVSKVSVGMAFVCAIQDNLGSQGLKCWGRSDSQNLGPADGSTTQFITGLETGVIDVATGGEHTCVAHNGGVKCFGANWYHQLGYKDYKTDNATLGAGSVLLPVPLSIRPGAQLDISLIFTPTEGGTLAATASVANDDSDENPYSISLTGQRSDTAPTASAVSPSAFAEDTESIVALSYSDSESDQATTCSVSNLSNVSVSTACSCSAGSCSVGVTGLSNYNGSAGFDFTVTANSAVSNTAAATLSISPVDDAPEGQTINPSSFDEDTEAIITLPYTDAEGHSATLCQITNLSNVTETQACSCSAGTCTVGVTGTSNYHGAGGFDYQVTANGLQSTLESASFTIQSVIDNYSITGIVTGNSEALAGATVNLSGGITRQGLSGSDGTYTFTNIPEGTAYTVAAALGGYVFVPESYTGTITGSVAHDFNSTVQFHSISGTVSSSGIGVSGVTVGAGALGSTTTSADGSFTLTNIRHGTVYQLSFSRADHVFSPHTLTGTLIGDITLQVAAYDLATIGATIKGIVEQNGEVVADALVSLTSHSQTQSLSISAKQAPYHSVTSQLGQYEITGVAKGSYELKVEKHGMIISSRQVVVNETTADPSAPENSQPILSLSDLIVEETSLDESVFTFWNTFLGQVNIVEIANTSATQANVTVTAFLPDGQITREFPISARNQIDLNLNDLFGLPIDSYGLIGIASASNSLSGRHTQYGPSPDNPNEFDFVYSLPLTNPQRGRTYLSVNTFEAFAPADAPPVYNWLALGNPTESPQGFTVLWYNHNGQLVGNREIPIPALSRVDLEAGHSSYGSGFAGLVEIIPSDTTASYTAASLRIGGAVEGARSNKIFVAANPAQRGNTQSQTVMLDNLPGTYEIVEISNTDNAQGCVWLSVFDDRGSLLSRENITLAPYAQSHVNAAAALPINSSGSLLLEPVEGLSIVATKFLYSQNEALEVNVFSASAVQPFGKKDVGSFNLYLGMANWLRVLNAANDSQTIVVRMHNKTGTEQLLSFNLPSHGRRDLDLHAMQAFIDKSDSYGAISVEAETPGAIVAELLRVEGRPKSQTGFMNLTQFQ